MKGYLSEQPLLRHIGKDEKQTANVHGVLKKLPLGAALSVCVKGGVALFGEQLIKVGLLLC